MDKTNAGGALQSAQRCFFQYFTCPDSGIRLRSDGVPAMIVDWMFILRRESMRI